MTQSVVLPRDVGIAGEVVLEVVVERSGRVIKVSGVSGDPRLIRAAKPSVMKWVFTPYFLNGAAVQFLTNLTFQFDGKKNFAKLHVKELDPLSSQNPPPAR